MFALILPIRWYFLSRLCQPVQSCGHHATSSLLVTKAPLRTIRSRLLKKLIWDFLVTKGKLSRHDPSIYPINIRIPTKNRIALVVEGRMPSSSTLIGVLHSSSIQIAVFYLDMISRVETCGRRMREDDSSMVKTNIEFGVIKIIMYMTKTMWTTKNQVSIIINLSHVSRFLCKTG